MQNKMQSRVGPVDGNYINYAPLLNQNSKFGRGSGRILNFEISLGGKHRILFTFSSFLVHPAPNTTPGTFLTLPGAKKAPKSKKRKK